MPKMMQAHDHADEVIGEYCQENVDHYEEALMSNAIVCELFPVEK